MGGVPNIGFPVIPPPAIVTDYQQFAKTYIDINYITSSSFKWEVNTPSDTTFRLFAEFSYEAHTGQAVRVSGSITFNRATGTPVSVSNSMPSVSSGVWTGAVRRWPMWEISGAHFRFFGQNWIRLIKVSGP